MGLDETQQPQGQSPGNGPSRGPGRAGRNLPVAIAVGLALGALVLASLYVAKVAFVAVATVAIGIGVWELSRALRKDEIHVPTVPLLIGAVAMLVGGYLRGPDALVVAFALTVLAVIVWRLPDGVDGYFRDVSGAVFAAAYVPFLAGFAVMLLVPPDGPHRVVTLFALVASSDTGGYFTGILLGRHPMAPRVSPKKTWEGFAGSVVTSTGVGSVLVMWLLDGAWWQGAALGAAIACSATLGDLGESMLKRDLGIKDMGSLIPGHGGMMDRLDSLLATAPVAWLLLSVFVPLPG